MKTHHFRRQVDVAVISDVHLGTYGCHAKELLLYLKSIHPTTLVLNGDFIDIWQFSKRYWPKSHMRVIREILDMVSRGCRVYYITGNHDELLRRFEGFSLNTFSITNKVLLPLSGGERAWIFHGDVFDVTMKHARWLARLGAVGYDALILLNRAVNFVSERLLGRGRISLSKRIKNSVKSAVSFINDFEQTAAAIGVANGYDYVVCGHIHHPEIKTIATARGSITYLNSGDWVENLTALEYHQGQWQLYQFQQEHYAHTQPAEEGELSSKELFRHLLAEFQLQAL